MSIDPGGATLATDRIARLSVSHLPALINDAQEGLVVSLGSADLRRFQADLHRWTDVAIGLMGEELRRQGAGAAAAADSSIRIAVTKAYGRSAIAGCEVSVWLEAKTSGGDRVEVVGTEYAGKRVDAARAALSRAVENLLDERRIAAFLQR